MNRFIPQPRKTYATEANAIAAVEKSLGDAPLRYMVVCNAEGRFFPIFIGEQGLQYGVHFRGFTIVS